MTSKSNSKRQTPKTPLFQDFFLQNNIILLIILLVSNIFKLFRKLASRVEFHVLVELRWKNYPCGTRVLAP